MPLAQCPICEKSISKRAYACPGCGEPDPFHRRVKFKALSTVLWIAAIVGGLYLFWVYGLPMLIDLAHKL
ncbi:hypothetical protein [Vibrio algivorus]|uniref:DUF2116 family Zn-ribbon domain-containing protein n=1 Tax=Vibrio algivorus TaxID=1667024 RepID=A0ABQ6EN43_9VIBR|nr:hypothetical protein [Vibrio algivorus]GLT14414.1 hypothetical protein GCM10007931_13890 [Vibrio algivorus]